MSSVGTGLLTSYKVDLIRCEARLVLSSNTLPLQNRPFLGVLNANYSKFKIKRIFARVFSLIILLQLLKLKLKYFVDANCGLADRILYLQ